MSLVPEPRGEKEIVRRFEGMIARQRQLVGKIAELDSQRLEYSRVASTIKPMDGSRRCYQLINTVLVEKTLAEVVPFVEANLDGLESVVRKLNEDLAATSLELREYQTKHNIRVVPPKGQEAAAGAGEESTGVIA